VPTTYDHDAAGRVTSIARGGVAVGVTYDAAGRRTSLSLPGGITVESAYDAASQLTGLTCRRGGEPIGTLTYGYDRAGRRVRVGGTWARVALPPASTAANDDADRVLTFGGAVATHDANGNLTSDGARTFTWNARDQLVAVDGPGLAVRYAYDALGRRREVSSGGVATRFVFDGLAVASILGADETQPVLNGPDGDEPLVVGEPGDLRVLLADAVGSVLALGDDAGAIAATFTYQPFGARSDPGSPGAFRFAGREDDGAGLSFHRARHYHLALQRYLSENPAGVVAGRANRYAYARHDPLGRVDPLGVDADPRPRSAANLALDVADPIAGSPTPTRALRVPGIGAGDSMMVERVLTRAMSPEPVRAAEMIDLVDGGAGRCPSTSPLAPLSDAQVRAARLRLPARCGAR
jgi:RHS repeat-associated protein